MKIVTIGDTHGRTAWKIIVKRNPGAHFIFTGDYLDAYKAEKIEEEEAIDNFEEIIEFKKSNPDKVILLIGNHDAQYLFPPNFGCSVRSKKYFWEIADIFMANKNLFDFAFQKSNYLWTHAGVSNEWFFDVKELLNSFGLKPDLSNLGTVLNKIGKDSRARTIYTYVSHYRGGLDLNGSPIWADTTELYRDSLDGFHQIVGHNKFVDIMSVGTDDTSITFVDCLFSTVKELKTFI